MTKENILFNELSYLNEEIELERLDNFLVKIRQKAKDEDDLIPFRDLLNMLGNIMS